MKRRVLLVFLLLQAAPLPAMNRQPWLGNLYEFEGAIVQEHTHSNTVSTTHGRQHKSLHSDYTKALLSVTPSTHIHAGIELDLAKTQKKGYGFDSFKAAMCYSWLNDIAGDAISLTTGLRASVSTASRVADLSSINHGICELEANLAIGKEFGYSGNGFYRAWTAGFVGSAGKGSPWIGAECHFERVIHDKHYMGIFLLAEKGTSSHKLSKHTHFRRWASIGYEFEDVGVRYAFKEAWLASAYIQVAKRIHAHFCPRNSWSVQIGITIPFSLV
jgi:hypothetical protein